MYALPICTTNHYHKAHENNDKIVLKAYGFSAKMSKQEIVAELIKMYKALDAGQKGK